MLDVIHFYFEEDNFYVSPEAVESRSKLREVLYKQWFDQDYKYKIETKKKSTPGSRLPDDFEPLSNDDVLSDEEAAKPFNPREMATKPYIEPTSPDLSSDSPFGDILGSPMSH